MDRNATPIIVGFFVLLVILTYPDLAAILLGVVSIYFLVSIIVDALIDRTK